MRTFKDSVSMLFLIKPVFISLFPVWAEREVEFVGWKDQEERDDYLSDEGHREKAEGLYRYRSLEIK